MEPIALTDREFAQFRDLLRGIAGIHLSPAKKSLVCGRLGKRLRDLNLTSYSQYLQLIAMDKAHGELQTVVDLLTTNETFFFRESKHFEFLRRCLSERRSATTFRAWSAACSSGEEPYSIAMVLATCLGESSWEVVGSDISRRMLEKAMAATYGLDRIDAIPADCLRRFCLKGVGSREGTLLIDEPLRNRVRFFQINLNEPLPNIGKFDVIFLRNVMIYFDMPTKTAIVERVASLLKPDGYFFIGHSESLHGVTEALDSVMPSIYRKP